MGDFAIVGGFEEGSVWGAFAGGVEAVAGVEEDFHVVGGRQLGDSFAKVGIIFSLMKFLLLYPCNSAYLVW